MVVEESAMTDEVLNTLVVLGHRLLLVEVGGGFETHLCEATSDSAARAALDTRRALPDSLADALERGGDDDRLDALLDRLLDTAWKPTTLCGRAWDEMAAGEAGAFRRWQEMELTPTCRSGLRVVDTWFPTSGPLPGIGVLVSVIGEKVEAFGWVQDARVVGCVERHARLPGSLVVQAETLRFGGELVGDGPPVGIVDALVGKEVGEQHTATVADTPVGELAFLEELHQVGPGDVQDVRSLLGRELSVHRCDGYGVAVGDLGEDVDQQPQGVARDLQGGVGVVGIQRDGDPGEVGVLAEEPFEDIDGLSSLIGCGLVGDGELVVEERGRHGRVS